MRLLIASMQATDARDHGGNFLVSERRPASGAVPAEEQLHHHRRVHAVPEQVPGQRRERVIAFAHRDAFANEPSPVSDRVTASRRFFDCLS